MQVRYRAASLLALMLMGMPWGSKDRSAAAYPVPDRPGESKRVAPPTEAQKESILKTIKDTFREDYKDSSLAGLQALVQKLQRVAADSDAASGVRYVLLWESRKAAQQILDLQAAFAALEAIDKSYDIDVHQLKLDLLQAALLDPYGKARPPSERLLVAKWNVRLADDDRAHNRYADALSELTMARAIAVACHDRTYRDAIDGTLSDFNKERLEYYAGVAALMRLDPECFELLGRFESFTKDHWDKGLPLLRICLNAKLRKLAVLDLSFPKEGGKRLELADGWWELGESLTKTPIKKMIVQARASQWYLLAYPLLSGFDKSRAEARMAPVPKLPGAEHKIPGARKVTVRNNGDKPITLYVQDHNGAWIPASEVLQPQEVRSLAMVIGSRWEAREGATEVVPFVVPAEGDWSILSNRITPSSTEDPRVVTLNIQNLRKETIVVYWVTFGGELYAKDEIKPGKMMEYQTKVEHRWIVFENGKPVSKFHVKYPSLWVVK